MQPQFMASSRSKASAVHALLAAKQGHVWLVQPAPKPAHEFVPLADERILLQVLPALRPSAWHGLRRLSSGTAEAVTDQMLKAANSRMNTIIPSRDGENLCSMLGSYSDGATVVLAPGLHHWSGKLHAERISIFGLPGATIKGRVQLAEGSSGSIYDIDFRSEDGGNVRLQDASWSLHGCTLECGDSDVAAVTATSSKLALHRCRLMGIETETARRPCWMGLLAKGASSVSAKDCTIGPHVQRGIVAVDDAVVHLTGGCIQGCEEIGLRLNGHAHFVGQQAELINGGMALHIGPSCTGSLELHGCHVDSFRTLGSGNFRPPTLDMQNTQVTNIGILLDLPDEAELSDSSYMSSDA